MPCITYEFEDLPLLVVGPLSSITVTGAADVEYTDEENWWISAVGIDGDRRPDPWRREAPKPAKIEVSPRIAETRDWFARIATALVAHRSAVITDAICDADPSAAVPPAYAEHRLTARGLGVGRFR